MEHARLHGAGRNSHDLRNLGQLRPSDAYGPGGNPERLVASGAVLFGSPYTVRDRLLAYLDEAGPAHNYLVAAIQWGDLTHAEAMQSLRLYASEVVPALEEGRVGLGV